MVEIRMDVVMKVLDERFEGMIEAFRKNWMDQSTARIKADGELQMLFSLGIIESKQARDLYNDFCNRLYKAAKEKRGVSE